MMCRTAMIARRGGVHLVSSSPFSSLFFHLVFYFCQNNARQRRRRLRTGFFSAQKKKMGGRLACIHIVYGPFCVALHCERGLYFGHLFPCFLFASGFIFAFFSLSIFHPVFADIPGWRRRAAACIMSRDRLDLTICVYSTLYLMGG